MGLVPGSSHCNCGSKHLALLGIRIPDNMPDNEAHSQLEELQQRLGYGFRERQLLVNALCHSSYVNENPHLQLTDNERLEFLGDAALELAVSHLLVERFPHYREGELSRLRSGLVNEKQLALLAEELRLGSFLYLGKGEERTGGRQKPSLLADACEALLAAVYLDGGFRALKTVVDMLFSRFLSEDDDFPQSLDKDYKTRLQELMQSLERITPEYRLEAEEGPDHKKQFRVSVWVRDRLMALGSGPTKKAAQQKAAGRALRLLESKREDG